MPDPIEVIDQLPAHPVLKQWRDLTDGEYRGLRDHIAEHGLDQPIVTWRGQLVDGRSRLRACRAVGVEPQATELPDGWTEHQVISFVEGRNGHRRHLSTIERAFKAAKEANAMVGRAKENSPNSDDRRTLGAMARRYGVSRSTVAEAKRIDRVIADGGGLFDDVPNRCGGSTVVKNAVKEALADFRTTSRAAKARAIQACDSLNSLKSAVETARNAARRRVDLAIRHRNVLDGNLARHRNVTIGEPNPLTTPYRVIVLDPPWDAANAPYSTMTLEEIRSLRWCRGSLPADPRGTFVYLWCPNRFLPNAFEIMDEWCDSVFQGQTMVWHKNGGMQYPGGPQSNAEFIVCGRIGEHTEYRETKNFSCVFNAPRRGHSVKPAEFFETIRRVTAGPRISMFERQKRPGFVAWGDEAPGPHLGPLREE